MNRAGKRTREWESERAKLKVKFLAMGITECELRLHGCWVDNALGFAHPKKRRNLKRHELGVVVLACNSCHDQIELLPEDDMARTVLGIIAKRNPKKRYPVGCLMIDRLRNGSNYPLRSEEQTNNKPPSGNDC